MILDKNDPTGLGLFSRYARNHACKNTKSRPKTANTTAKIHPKQISENQRKKIHQKKNLFELQQSRQQRQIRYRRQLTPAVGQYNPMKKTKPKMVWDILKVYQSNNKKLKIKQKIRTEQQLDKSVQMIQDNQIQHHHEEKGQEGFKNTNSKVQEVFSEKPKNFSQQKLKTHMHGCIDMSRMTGRIDGASRINEFGYNSQTLDINKSIDFLKKKAQPYISFNKQLSRDQVNKSYKTPSHDYNFNFQLVKPRKIWSCKFDKMAGRYRKNNQQNNFSYIHYDYNNYVWNNASSIFPNTKTHNIDFNKQIKRKNIK